MMALTSEAPQAGVIAGQVARSLACWVTFHILGAMVVSLWYRRFGSERKRTKGEGIDCGTGSRYCWPCCRQLTQQGYIPYCGCYGGQPLVPKRKYRVRF